MKFFSILLSITSLSTITLAQTVTVSGKVNNENGEVVPYAFVRDTQHNYATFTDSTGFFILKADPASSLEVLANAYNPATIKVNNKIDLMVKLSPGSGEVRNIKSLNGDASTSTGGNVNTFIQNSQLMITNSILGGSGNGTVQKTIIKEGFNQEPTRGTRYLYDNWVVGYGVNKKDSLVVELPYAYNYDKITGGITYTNDGRSMSTVSTQQIKNFSLFDKNGHPNVYEATPLFANKQFIEVLLSTPKYKIYKKIDTKIVRADFHTDGVVESGHKYDEYVDVVRYYFVGADGKLQTISLKKNTLKKVLGTDADSFIAGAGSRDVDEDYVRELSSSLIK